MAYVLSENRDSAKQRNWNARSYVKANRRKVNLSEDFEDVELDCGTCRVGKSHKFPEKVWTVLEDVLMKHVGRSFNDIRHELTEVIQRRTIHGRPFEHYLNRVTRLDWYRTTRTGFMVDEDGTLQYRPYNRPRVALTIPVEKLHYKGNQYFVRKQYLDNNCACWDMERAYPCYRKGSGVAGRLYDHRPKAMCKHGHRMKLRDTWAILSISFHEPDEVYRSWVNEDGTKTVKTYADVPHLLADPIIRDVKTPPNKKELAILRKQMLQRGLTMKSFKPLCTCTWCRVALAKG